MMMQIILVSSFVIKPKDNKIFTLQKESKYKALVPFSIQSTEPQSVMPQSEKRKGKTLRD